MQDNEEAPGVGAGSVSDGAAISVADTVFAWEEGTIGGRNCPAIGGRYIKAPGAVTPVPSKYVTGWGVAGACSASCWATAKGAVTNPAVSARWRYEIFIVRIR